MPYAEDLLLDFCRSVDALDENAFNRFRNLAREVFETEFRTIHSDIKIDRQFVNGRPALDTMRLDSDTRQYQLYKIVEADGNYRSQRTFSYDNDCPLWITTKSGKPIAAATPRDVVIEAWDDNRDGFDKIKSLYPPIRI